MTNEFKVSQNTLTYDTYKELCFSVGWKEFMNFDVAEQSLSNSLVNVIVKDGNRAIGMGRVVGDGSIYFYIQDVVVHPDYQGRGVGKRIMDALFTYLQEHAPDKAFVGLFASTGNDSFYEKYGFKDYSPNMTGMFTVIQK
ncbi:GNAT family N-acetyltransferase [Evansella tamaricis]|uniref:GNAT family N-acetyltransferase n=1 Tax=Evansella tamaricis TaxID=2069301 RepID=A0ABS6J9M0_9BACI|nr:GNAT family N-acetyltransferase [Evansella tamaricis]MBU9710231.1 GNAT family N-acetyltransferase [Evansella tamaricis]